MARGQPEDGSKSLSSGKVLLPHAQENREKSEACFVRSPAQFWTDLNALSLCSSNTMPAAKRVMPGTRVSKSNYSRRGTCQARGRKKSGKIKENPIS